MAVSLLRRRASTRAARIVFWNSIAGDSAFRPAGGLSSWMRAVPEANPSAVRRNRSTVLREFSDVIHAAHPDRVPAGEPLPQFVAVGLTDWQGVALVRDRQRRASDAVGAEWLALQFREGVVHTVGVDDREFKPHANGKGASSRSRRP